MHTSRTMYQSSFTPNHKSKHPVAQFCSQLNEIYFVLHLFFFRYLVVEPFDISCIIKISVLVCIINTCS